MNLQGERIENLQSKPPPCWEIVWNARAYVFKAHDDSVFAEQRVWLLYFEWLYVLFQWIIIADQAFLFLWVDVDMQLL